MKSYKIFLSLLVLAALPSCTLIDLEDKPEPQPTTGSVSLSTDWGNRTEGIDIPSSYVVEINNRILTLNHITGDLPELEAGVYPTLIYNRADKITPDGTVATVATESSVVDPTPGWLFTAAQDIVYEAGKKKNVTVVMEQQVRRLSIELAIAGGNPDDLQSVTASLSGVANSMDFKENTYSGTGLSVIPVLEKEGNTLKGVVRLIGLSPEAQKITLTVKFSDGKEQVVETDISDKLEGFNQNKHRVMILSAAIEIANKTGFEATIDNWEAKESSSGTAW